MNKDSEEQQTHLSSMPSRPKFPLEEEEVKAKETIEEKEEVEAKTEEEETTLQVEGATIKIRTKAKAVASMVEKIKHMDKGMTNLNSNVITVRNMAIMPMNVGRNRVTWVIDPMQILLEKISTRLNRF